MSATIQQYVPLREVIFDYLSAAKQDDTKYLRLWNMAFRGFKSMGLNYFWMAKTEVLPVNDNRTVTLPDDYINWTKIGQLNGTEISLMRSNGSLITANSPYKGIADVVGSNYWYYGHDRFGATCYKRPVEFKIVDGAILLDTNFEGDSILLEYIYAPEQDDDFTIPVQFTECLIDWISWQDIKHIPSTSHFGRGEKNDRALAFRASLKQAKRSFKPLRASELLGGEYEFNQ